MASRGSINNSTLLCLWERNGDLSKSRDFANAFSRARKSFFVALDYRTHVTRYGAGPGFSHRCNW
jgi:hypothetical protein